MVIWCIILLVNTINTVIQAVRHTTQWCCDWHPDSAFHICQFFKRRFLYQDLSTLNVYYGDVDEKDCKQVLPPPKAKQKHAGKLCTTADCQELVCRILNCCLHPARGIATLFRE